MIRVQREEFDVGAELAALTKGDTGIGGVCIFVGLCRDFADGETVKRMTLEHYPAMTARELEKIDAEAHERWRLRASLIVHRYGELVPGDQIVLVAVASSHRDVSFEACHFLIDWLKTRAPFWKCETTLLGNRWVTAQESDNKAASLWQSMSKTAED